MGLRGPAPKPADQLANPSSAAAERARIRIVKSKPVDAPSLPLTMPGGEEWPEETKHWWECWTTDPLTEGYCNSDWLDLLDCVLIHGRLWSGDDKAAAELRLRMSKHGATREDRAKLRITYATANITEVREHEAKNKVPKADKPSSKERRGGLHSMPTFSDEPEEPGF